MGHSLASTLLINSLSWDSLTACFSLFHPLFPFHTHTDTHKQVPLMMKRTSWILSLSLSLLSSFFPLLLSPSPTVVFWTSNQDSLSLSDSPLFIPHSQRAFFNTQRTHSLAFLLGACACGERKRECEIAKEMHKENEKSPEKVRTRKCVCVCVSVSACAWKPALPT